jgi:hypothetical protein
MKTMASHSSATAREQSPHTNRTTRTATILDALTTRAQAVLNDESIDAQTRAVLRYALETNDPWLARLARRANAGEKIFDTADVSQTRETESIETDEDEVSEDKIEALAELICRAADESPIALLVLMRMFEKSAQPQTLANTLKHFAFTRCGELNVNGIVDAQIAALDAELFAGSS